METLSEAVVRLAAAGFLDSFVPEDGRLRALMARRLFFPEELVVEEVVRFEGDSDPGDEAILFALRSHPGDVRGTFATGYGATLDPASAEVVRRLVRGR